MKVNRTAIKGIGFAFDGCHKIYIVANEAESNEAKEMGYQIYPLDRLPYIWRDSCPLRFISSWDLETYFVKQGEDAIFEFNN